MAVASKSGTKRTAKKPKSIQKQTSLIDFFKNGGRLKFLVAILVAVVAIGVYTLFFASAATNNCQKENGVDICDVDQTAGGADTVLSLRGEAEALAQQGWGIYYGAAFRAPTTSYNGAVPVHRLNNGSASWHEFTTDAQKGQKEAAAGGAQNLVYEGVSFFAWNDASQSGTVPVYRITRGGTGTQSMYSTDKAWVDKMIASGAWEGGTTMPLVAFYAYPPNYAVAEAVNPYDCSILVNFESPRCAKAVENLKKNVEAGNVTASTECPKTWGDWNKNVNPGQFDKACQDAWNNYGKDCSNTEVLATDRCANERKALEDAAKAAIKAREEANRVAAEATKKANTPVKGGPSSSTGTSSGKNPASTTSSIPCPATYDEFSNMSDGDRSRISDLNSCQTWHLREAANRANDDAARKKVEEEKLRVSEANKTGTCTIRYKMEKAYGFIGKTQGSKVYNKVTNQKCIDFFKSNSRYTMDGMNRKHYDYTYTWIVDKVQTGGR